MVTSCQSRKFIAFSIRTYKLPLSWPLLNSCTSLNTYPLACKEYIFFSLLTIGMTILCSSILVCFPILNNLQTCWTILSITSLRTLVCEVSESGAVHLLKDRSMLIFFPVYLELICLPPHFHKKIIFSTKGHKQKSLTFRKPNALMVI